MTERNFGADFKWWVGTVVSVNDPTQSGRLQVRVYGAHDDTVGIPNNALPWMLPEQTLHSAAIGKIGTSTVGAVVGTRVRGYWQDRDMQLGVVTATLGKSGDAIPGQTTNGAPSIDYTTGSIPPAAIGNPNNSRSQLNTSVTPITDIDSGSANVFSVSSTEGIVVTAAVEKLMKYPKTPTTAYADKTNTNDIIPLIQSVDPRFTSAANPCSINALLDIGNLLSIAGALADGIENEFKNLLISAMTNAILTLAKDIGIFKVLGFLQAATQDIEEVQSILSALNSLTCGPNVINQGSVSPTNLILAGVLNNIQNLVNTSENVFNNIVAAPIASVATAISAVPPVSSILNIPPASYVQQYSSTDPYPGYIIWTDPAGILPNVYTLRNGQPNYISAQQHTFFTTQNNLSVSLLPALAIGVIAGSVLTSIVSSTISISQSFAISAVLGGISTPTPVSSYQSSLQNNNSIINSSAVVSNYIKRMQFLNRTSSSMSTGVG